jgi:predicted RNA binding protein YcfA (HicA-like mRNA interferase family)
MNPKLPRVSGERVTRALKRAGWYEHHKRGSHVYLRHSGLPGVQVTVSVHGGQDLLPKTLSSILKQAGLEVEEFLRLL